MNITDRHYEAGGMVSAPAEQVFDFVDDHSRLSSHMERSSLRMGGGRMTIELDTGLGQAVGSHIRLRGKVLGILLSVDEVVTERLPPTRKVWETVGTPRLLVIGHYRMGFTVTPQPSGVMFRVFIDYGLPDRAPARWLGFLFGRLYAKWCTRRMVTDAVRHFELPPR